MTMLREFQVSFRRVTVPAVAALRMYWGTVALLTGTGLLALTAFLPIAALLHTGPGPATRLGPWLERGADLGVGWSQDAQAPAATQQQGVDVLFHLLLGTGVATLGIAAVTILTLFGARASRRESEVQVSRAVGASRRALAASALLEGVIIAAAVLATGCAAGMVSARWAVGDWPGRILPGTLVPSLASLVPIGAVILAGAILPLIFARSSRIVEAEVKPAGLLGPAVLQLGVSLAVLGVSALLSRHAGTLLAGPGSAARTGQVFELGAPDLPPADRSARYASLLNQLDDGGSSLVSLTSPGALVGLGTVSTVTTDCGICSSGGISLRWHMVWTTHQFVSADSFKALGVHLVAGRGITRNDQWSGRPVAVISRALAERHFQKGEAIGRQMLVGDNPRTWHTVVGVVDDPPSTALGGRLQPHYTVYLSILQHPIASAELLVRARPAEDPVPVVRRALQAAFGQIALGTSSMGTAPMAERAILAAEAAPVLWFSRWFAVEGWATLAIAVVGTFSLMRIWVLSLRPELGIRRAVGASRARLLLGIATGAGRTGLVGAAFGLWFGQAVWSTLPSVMTGAAGWNSHVLLRFTLLLVSTTLAGALIPAWHALRSTPASLLGSGGD
ncbi:MAG: FtsX-like permease family protein [Gemmatimonadales bacterium]